MKSGTGLSPAIAVKQLQNILRWEFCGVASLKFRKLLLAWIHAD